MELRATKAFSSTVLGNVSEGDRLPHLSEGMAKHFVENGLAEEYDTKVIEQKPKPAKRKNKGKEDD